MPLFLNQCFLFSRSHAGAWQRGMCEFPSFSRRGAPKGRGGYGMCITLYCIDFTFLLYCIDTICVDANQYWFAEPPHENPFTHVH